jgi:hypothetical protein
MFVYSNMRKFVAYILIAITLLSNGMVDFAIKVCHDSNLNANAYGVFEQNNIIEFSNSIESECKTSSKYPKNTPYYTENRLNSKKSTLTSKKKSCCSPKASVKQSESTILNKIRSSHQKKYQNNAWTRISDILFLSDEHPCCADNSKAQIKCCTLLNLYYFTPKFLEETEDLIPNIIWQEVLSPGELMRFYSLVQLKNNTSEFIDRSDPPVLYSEDITSSYCVWII